MFHEIFEAYTHDLATPFKKCLPEYKIAENKALATFAKMVGLPEEMPYDVHLADKRMMITEALAYMPDKDYWLEQAKVIGEKEFGFPLIPYDISKLRKLPLEPEEAEKDFAKRWLELGLPSSDIMIEMAENTIEIPSKELDEATANLRTLLKDNSKTKDYVQ